MRYAFAYTKGGVGKTNNAVHLATYFARQSPTLLIDGDPQGTGAAWAAWRSDTGQEVSPVTVQLHGKAIYDQGAQLAENYAHTVIDTGGRDGPGMRNALLLADRVIVPMGISGFDGGGVRHFLEVFEEAQSINRGLRVKALISRIHPSSKDDELREFLAERGVSTFTTVIRERRAYQIANTEGLTVEELRPKNKATAAASGEMGRLYKEIEAWQ